MSQVFSLSSRPAVTIAWAGAMAAILAGLTSTLNGSIEIFIMNNWSVTVHWLTDVVPLVFTFFVVMSATLLSTAIASSLTGFLRAHVWLAPLACLVIGLCFDLGAWYMSGSTWAASWLSMLGRVGTFTAIESAIILAIVAVLRKHPLIDVENDAPVVADSSAEELLDVSEVV